MGLVPISGPLILVYLVMVQIAAQTLSFLCTGDIATDNVYIGYVKNQSVRDPTKYFIDCRELRHLPSWGSEAQGFLGSGNPHATPHLRIF